MKQKLLFILSVFLITVTLQAQDKIWDLGNDVSTWPISAGMVAGTSAVVDNLGLVSHPSSSTLFGAVEANSTSFSGDGFTAVKRFKNGGSGGADPAATTPTFVPTQRYLFFNVTANCTVKVWYRIGGTSLPRALYITDGSASLASFVSTGTDTPDILTGSYVGGAGTVYIFSSGNAFNFYKVEVSPASALGTTTLGLDAKTSAVTTNLQAVGNRIFVSNVKSNTEVNIYSITGALVKSIKTNSNTDFAFRAGLYIATVKTIEGQKSVKLLLN